MPTPHSAPRESLFVTGGTGFLGRRLVQMLAREGHDLLLLVRKSSRRRARAWIADWRSEEPEAAGRIRLLGGDLGREEIFDDERSRKRVMGSAQSFVHLGAATDPAVDRTYGFAVNVDGTRRVLDLARLHGGLRRVLVASDAQVSGNHRGLFTESMLLEGQDFGSVYAETKMVAERRVRKAAGELPTTVIRPGHLVGDSRTGEAPASLTLYRLLLPLLRLSRLPSPLSALPLAPGGNCARVNLVPVDYVAAAAHHLLFDPAAEGGVFQLCCPHAPTVRQVLDRLSGCTGASKGRINVPNKWVQRGFRSALGTPLRRLLNEAYNLNEPVLGHAATYALHDTTHAEALLRPEGIEPPQFDDYFDTLVSYARRELL